MARRRFGTASSVAPADKMGLADNRERKADARTGAETKRDLDMLDRKIRLPGHQPDAAALDGLALVSKVELRAMTNSQRMRDSAVMISSTMPSAKYSCSGSPLILAKGSTAIDGLSGSGSTGCASADALLGAPGSRTR